MDNKEKILESALDLFYSKGYDAVGVQEIVERSGIYKTYAVSLFWQQIRTSGTPCPELLRKI